jgi:hypothetical protein
VLLQADAATLCMALRQTCQAADPAGILAAANRRQQALSVLLSLPAAATNECITHHLAWLLQVLPLLAALHHAHPAVTACSEAPRVPKNKHQQPRKASEEHAQAYSCSGSTTAAAAATKPLQRSLSNKQL